MRRKGLEFDTVYLIHTNEGCIPYKRALEENGLEEERRLILCCNDQSERSLKDQLCKK